MDVVRKKMALNKLFFNSFMDTPFTDLDTMQERFKLFHSGDHEDIPIERALGCYHIQCDLEELPHSPIVNTWKKLLASRIKRAELRWERNYHYRVAHCGENGELEF